MLGASPSPPAKVCKVFKAGELGLDFGARSGRKISGMRDLLDLVAAK